MIFNWIDCVLRVSLLIVSYEYLCWSCVKFFWLLCLLYFCLSFPRVLILMLSTSTFVDMVSKYLCWWCLPVPVLMVSASTCVDGVCEYLCWWCLPVPVLIVSASTSISRTVYSIMTWRMLCWFCCTCSIFLHETNSTATIRGNVLRTMYLNLCRHYTLK